VELGGYNVCAVDGSKINPEPHFSFYSGEKWKVMMMIEALFSPSCHVTNQAEPEHEIGIVN
jgi:hypothetical protein